MTLPCKSVFDKIIFLIMEFFVQTSLFELKEIDLLIIECMRM